MRSSLKRAFHVALVAAVATGGLTTAGTIQPANAFIFDTRFCRNHPRDPHCHPYHRPACGYHHHLDRFGHCVRN